MKTIISKSILGLAAVVLVQSASAAINLGTVISGTAPSVTPAWVTAQFTSVNATTVQLRIEVPNLSTGGYLDKFYFNYNGSGSPTLKFSTGTANNVVTSVNGFNSNGYNAGGGSQGYDFKINFENSDDNGGVKRFINGEFMVFTITVPSGTQLSAFDVTNTKGPKYIAAAHINGYKVNKEDASAWIGNGSGPGGTTPVPEPSTYFAGLSALGMLALGFRKHK